MQLHLCLHPLFPLRTVPACVSVVPAGPADGAGVTPQDGAGHLTVVWFKCVGPIHARRLPVLPAEAAKVLRGPAAAARVRQTAAADWPSLWGRFPFLSIEWSLDVARLLDGLLPGLMCVSKLHRLPVAHQERVQVHVVVPHIEALEVHSCLLCGHFWKTRIVGVRLWRTYGTLIDALP